MPLEPGSGHCGVVGKALDQAPKTRPVVHFGEMRHLMRDDIADDRLGRENQPPAEGKISVLRTASPAALRITPADPRRAVSDLGCKPVCSATELAARDRDEKIADAARHKLRIAAHADLAIDDRYTWTIRARLSADRCGIPITGRLSPKAKGTRRGSA